MEKNKSFSELLRYWKDISGYDTTKCKQVFPSFDKWVYRESIPRESNFGMICDRTGFKREEIVEAVEESKRRKGLREESRKYNIKYGKVSPESLNASTPIETDATTLDFDTVLKEYMNYTKEKEALMEKFLEIKDKLEAVKVNLTRTRELLKKCV